MKKIAIKTYGKIITLLFALLGIGAGCEKPLPVPEYGVPAADFIIKGKVTDRESKKPLKNIAVIRKTEVSPIGNDTVRTNARGDFELRFTAFPGEDNRIFAEDLDGEDNGGWYGPDSILVNTKQMTQVKKGKGGWYDGIFEKKDANFKLQHFQPVPEYGVPASTYKEMKEDE